MLQPPTRRQTKPFRRRLLPGETVKWVGQPQWASGIGDYDASCVVAAVTLVLAITAVGYYYDFARRGITFATVLGVCSTVMGIGAIAFVLYQLVRLRSRMHVHSGDAITDKRVLFLSPLHESGCRALSLADAEPRIAKEGPDGGGAIVFEGQTVLLDEPIRKTARNLDPAAAEHLKQLTLENVRIPLMFNSVPDVRDVHDLILRLKRELPPQ